ncbi:alkaline phosphatase family protein [Speluncibacter jeojiensis]|uniref:Alkaline phosphatase family protein n=1 Tax=Speluncibacter jeojiensis TaxID=2710754 RepID=A0A9X4M147_9ACTN|nr:alkaline phosphatase family protein [Corynebacteriales bacterium D3-21]
MSRSQIACRAAVGAAVLLAGTAFTGSVAAAAPPPAPGHSKHVLLISVDGLHQSDLTKYVSRHPGSAMARLVARGVDFTRAQTPVPSDSFPGTVAQLTGGNPKTTGIYYDDAYNRALLPAGTTSCAHAEPGAEVDLTEDMDKNSKEIDAGQGLSGLPGSVLSMTGNPSTVIDPAKLPVDPTTCTPVSPGDYLQVNTVFQVAKQAGLHTAWSDKHPVYEILNGPGGATPSIDDLFTPEINSQAAGAAPGTDWTKDNAKTQQYDGYKVRAVLNEIDGYGHARTRQTGEPAIFGMNFQSVSTAQKLPTSDGKAGGYLPGGDPGPLLASALGFVDSQIGRIVSELDRQHHADDTTVILSAKHGQSPIDPSTLERIDDKPIIDGLDVAWAAVHRGAAPLVAHSVDDDAMILWLSDHSQSAADFAAKYLRDHSGSGTDINGRPVRAAASGTSSIHAGADAAAFFGTSVSDPRVPDVFAVARPGVVYTGGKSKIAEHGGASADDRNVPIVVVGAGVSRHGTSAEPVETTSIAPTILSLLGLNPTSLQAVRAEHTPVLPVSGGGATTGSSPVFGS